MTESVSGPALSQAHAHHGATRYYSHLQSHTQSEHHHHDHQHLHHHQGSIRSPGHAHRILERDDSQPVVIVETVSIIQVIDSTGATVNVQTVSTTSDPSPTQSLTQTTTTLADQTSISASASTPEPSSGVSSYPGSSPDYDPTPQPTDTLSSSPGPTVTPPESGMPSSFPTLSYSPVTSTHLSHPHGFPSHSGVTNSSLTRSTTIASGNSSSTTTLLSYTTTVSNGSTLTIPLTETSFTTSDASSTGDSSSITFSSSETTTTTTDSASYSSVFATSTSSGGSQTLETEPLAGTPTPTNTAAAGQSSGSTEGPTSAVVAGSVVGAFAGLAFLLAAAFYLLRWKKRHDALKAIGGAGAAGVDRGLVGGGGGGGPSEPSSGAAAAMSEQSHSTPFAIPAALASLAGYKRSSRPRSSTGGAEGGFQKVSGRKLPSVLTSGGDGYTDPRDTMMSNESNPTYRDSMAIFGGAQPPPRFALGSPMRPESGVPVLQTGPARTPVMDQGPFSDYGPYRDDSPTLEPPMLDPLGRSRISQDGSSRSHMSGSRFYEDL